MSMRMGDESGRARAEALDHSSLVPEPIGTPAGRRCVADRGTTVPPPRGGDGRPRVPRVHVPRLLRAVPGSPPIPTEQHLLEPTSGPSASHWFGTDELSRDSLSRVLHGGQISLKVALGVAVLSTLIGVVIGALAGFYRGWLDGLLMRFTDLWIALPALPFLAVAVSIGTIDLGPFGSLDLGAPLGITLLLSCLLWGSIARVVRGADVGVARARVRRRRARHRRVEHAHHHPPRAARTAWARSS